MPGVLDQPRGGQLDSPTRPGKPRYVVRMRRDTSGDGTGDTSCGGRGGEHRVHEERSHAAVVGVGRIDDHGLRAPQRENGLAHVSRSRGAGLRAGRRVELPTYLVVPRRAVAAGAQGERHLEHDVALPVLFEETVSVGETAVCRRIARASAARRDRARGPSGWYPPPPVRRRPRSARAWLPPGPGSRRGTPDP